MTSRLPTLVLILLLALVLTQLFTGRGNLMYVMDLREQLQIQQESNEKLQQENDRLQAAVQDLREGHDMVEERARYEMGMVKPNEIFIQYVR